MKEERIVTSGIKTGFNKNQSKILNITLTSIYLSIHILTVSYSELFHFLVFIT